MNTLEATLATHPQFVGIHEKGQRFIGDGKQKQPLEHGPQLWVTFLVIYLKKSSTCSTRGWNIFYQGEQDEPAGNSETATFVQW